MDIELTSICLKLKSALGGIEMVYNAILLLSESMLKSALGGIEMDNIGILESKVIKLKSALGGIERSHKSDDEMQVSIVKISPWRD